MSLQKVVFPPIVAVFNHKGGVAKTTTAGNLAACLAALGYRVVLADLDAQGNATGSFGILPLPPVGAMDVITGRVPLDQALLPTAFPGLSLLPATTQLRTAELELAAHERSHQALREAFASQSIADHADIVIIDCPPSLGTITGNALAAAAAVLLPARPDPYSHEGLVNTWHEIKRLRQTANASLNVAGILLTMTGDDPTGGDVERSMRAEFGDQVYAHSIESDPKVTEAAQLGVPVAVLDPDGGAGAGYPRNWWRGCAATPATTSTLWPNPPPTARRRTPCATGGPGCPDCSAGPTSRRPGRRSKPPTPTVSPPRRRPGHSRKNRDSAGRR